MEVLSDAPLLTTVGSETDPEDRLGKTVESQITKYIGLGAHSSHNVRLGSLSRFTKLESVVVCWETFGGYLSEPSRKSLTGLKQLCFKGGDVVTDMARLNIPSLKVLTLPGFARFSELAEVIKESEPRPLLEEVSIQFRSRTWEYMRKEKIVAISGDLVTFLQSDVVSGIRRLQLESVTSPLISPIFSLLSEDPTFLPQLQLLEMGDGSEVLSHSAMRVRETRPSLQLIFSPSVKMLQEELDWSDAESGDFSSDWYVSHCPDCTRMI